MRAAEGGYEPGYDIGEDREIPAGSPETASNVTSGGTSGGETPCNDTAPQQQQQHPKRADEMRATFNSIEYSEAEIPNIIPKSTERLPRRYLLMFVRLLMLLLLFLLLSESIFDGQASF